MVLFDVVIPLGPDDISVIEKQIRYTQKNVIGYRNIYLVSCDPLINIKDCITIDEKIFPFTIDTIAHFHGKEKRNGWYLQQLLKLYAGFVIPNILEKYLVIDADTFFFKPTAFIHDNKCLYNYQEITKSHKFHPYYLPHMLKLNKNFNYSFSSKSGITHHMIFETKYIQEIFDIVEKEHKDKFYNIFLKHVSKETHSGASEYEIYFNYIFTNHSDKVKLRKLTWIDTGSFRTHHDCDYLSWHAWRAGRTKK